MCGIAGIVSDAPIQHVAQRLQAMLRTIPYRGPDDTALLVRSGIALGCNRLAIVDLEEGQQPMQTDDRDYAIVHNGEIFNAAELRESLQASGQHFTTKSDTEVILHSFRTHGHQALAGFNGDYAFAVWDEREQTLFVARDRFGVRPLFWTFQDGEFAFASEIKAIQAAFPTLRESDPVGLAMLFRVGVVKSPRTLVRNVHALPAGHFLTYCRGRVQHQEYWRLHVPAPADRADWPETKGVEQLTDMLRQSLQIRMHADVPLGFSLSGGIDSSLLCCMGSRLAPKPLRTFSVRHEQPEFNEAVFIDSVCQQIRSHGVSIRYRPRDILHRLPLLIRSMETPIVTTQCLAMAALFETAAPNVRVMIGGEGADELFGGYPHSVHTALKLRFDNVSRSALLTMFRKRARTEKIESFIFPSDLRQKENSELFGAFHPGLLGQLDFMDSIAGAILASDFRAALHEVDLTDELRISAATDARLHPVDRVLLIDLGLRLENHLLSINCDRPAMLQSIEGRYPFLDHRLAELAVACPPHIRLKRHTAKAVLRQVARPYLPERVLNREKFAGWAPLSLFTNSGLDPTTGLDDLVTPTLAREKGYFDPEFVSQLRTGQAHLSQNDVAETDSPIAAKDSAALLIATTHLWDEAFLGTT